MIHLFVVALSQIAKGGDCQDICENCQRHMLCILANLLTKHILLVIGQIQDELSTSRNKSSSLVLKPCKSIQETSEEVLFIKGGDCQDIYENCQRHMICILANLLTKYTLLVIGQIQDEFSTSRNKSTSLVLKSCKYIQETSEEVLFIKARQISRQNYIYRGLMQIGRAHV